MNFFVFQNPAVCYFAHIASIAENFETVLCAGQWASRSNFSVFLIALMARRGMREVRKVPTGSLGYA